MANAETGPVKLKRTLKACDFCHRRGRGCRLDPSDARCRTCIEFNVSCTFNRVSVKRGTKPRASKTPGSNWSLDETKHGARELVQDLLVNFFESVYPVSVSCACLATSC